MEQIDSKRIEMTKVIQVDEDYGILVYLSREVIGFVPDTLPKNINNIKISLITEKGKLIELLGSVRKIEDRQNKNEKYKLELAISQAPAEYYKYLEEIEENQFLDELFPDFLHPDLLRGFLEGKDDHSLDRIFQNQKKNWHLE